MHEINSRDTAILLAALDREIDIKCIELREKQSQVRLKKIFFSSCAFVLLSFFVQIFFKIFNLSLIFMIIAYQVVALTVVLSLVPNFYKGVISK